MKDIFDLSKKIIMEENEKDKRNMPILYNSFSDDEKSFIDEFMKKYKYDKEDIIFNEKSGCINFCYKNMQIGRIRLNNKKRKMQILTTNSVEWIENITLKDAISNIDKWIQYLDKLMKKMIIQNK